MHCDFILLYEALETSQETREKTFIPKGISRQKGYTIKATYASFRVRRDQQLSKLSSCLDCFRFL